MTREEHLVFCRKCLHRELDPKQGLVCDLTKKIADFTGDCPDFKTDPAAPGRVTAEPAEESRKEVMTRLDDTMIGKLKQYQDFNYALVGGLFAMAAGAVLWALISVAAHFQIGYMAIGVGLLVGLTVRYFGAGIDKKFGYIGAVLSLLGCLLGNLLTQVGFIAQNESLGYFETLTYLTPSIIAEIMVRSFHPLDLIFYVFATGEGYKLSFRRLNGELLQKFAADEYSGAPAGFKMRLPLVIAGIIGISFFILKMSQGISGIKTFYYESGATMSKGELKKGREHGSWTYWYESGKLQAEGNYRKGLRHGSWKWYYPTGNPESTGSYKNGSEHGVCINYHSNGTVSDSGNYVNGRLEGYSIARHENGNLMFTGYYKRDQADSLWCYYYETGILSATGMMKDGEMNGRWKSYFENGLLSEETEYPEPGVRLIRNSWDRQGNPEVIDGNGIYISTSPEGILLTKGMVKDSRQTGLWEYWYPDGTKQSSGHYIENEYLLMNARDRKGRLIVQEGNGFYEEYAEDGVTLIKSGEYKDGLKEGLWKTFYPASGLLSTKAGYHKGKLNGKFSSYSVNNILLSEGEFRDDKQEGVWNWYYNNGALKATAAFSAGKKEGTETFYSDSGEVIGKEEYEEGKLVEEWYL